MRDLILILCVIACMIIGYFLVEKAERLFHRSFRHTYYDGR